ncbi:glycine cleavage system protein T, partial [Candidatus Bathyarchaeota archaeon]|nr:glycine cleavage system protein T [Candidatus Bathyarchaeota archaeon]
PRALDTLQPIVHADLSGLKYFWGNTAKIENFDVFISRSGYTGEDGFEIILWNTPLDDPERAYSLWDMILQSGEKYGIKPCGLGARDTLRIEAGYVLYGNDIDEAITPLEAKLDFAVCFGKDYFIGREMLLKQKIEGVKRIRVGIRLLERGVLRPKCEIRLKDRVIGEVTSGTFSPLLKCGIGMGYVPVENAKPGTLVDVVIRGKMIEAVISKMPFYDTVKYGRKRKEK